MMRYLPLTDAAVGAFRDPADFKQAATPFREFLADF